MDTEIALVQQFSSIFESDEEFCKGHTAQLNFQLNKDKGRGNTRCPDGPPPNWLKTTMGWVVLSLQLAKTEDYITWTYTLLLHFQSSIKNFSPYSILHTALFSAASPAECLHSAGVTGNYNLMHVCVFAGEKKEPAILISMLLLQTHAPLLYSLALTRFCWNLESSTTNAWNAKNAIFVTRITRNIWTLDHMKVMHSSCTDQSKSSMSAFLFMLSHWMPFPGRIPS